jgi:subtilisin family serine protease
MCKPTSFRTTISLFLLAAFLTLPLTAAQNPGLTQARSESSLNETAQDYLNLHQVDGRGKIWAFFTDKGIFNKGSLTSALQTQLQTLSERAIARRAKHGVSGARLADLPVRQDYIEQIEALGADLRHKSKWLNAASFEVDLELLDQIAALSFVAKVQPVALYKQDYDDVYEGPSKQSAPRQATDAHSLDYGGSFAQLDQINVPTCHDAGYKGQGVIISVFDTGFRTTHDAFFQANMFGRILATWDFVFGDTGVDNEDEDWSSAWNHGTSTWSICGGSVTGTHYGPAYGSSFIVCKTEDIRSETEVEEDNWVAALEWVESQGADIITSSLSYSDWYTVFDYDGNTCVTTIAADSGAALGMLICNSAGNAGPAPSTLGAPADADSIMTIGAVESDGSLASFSSRGPTADGRIKPEVCARGVDVHRATSTTDGTFSAYGSGTSYSCPLVAGAAAIVWSANPEWTNMQVREALMMTADNSSTPDNDYGWGTIDTWAALNYDFGGEPFVPGDANGDGTVNISDATYIIQYIFAGGLAPDPLESGDADGSGEVNINDAVYIIAYIFAGGPAPVGQS